MSQKVVIVGSGLAGYSLARELRKLDTQIPLVIISQDAADFYSKPMLSNALASNKTATSLVIKSAEKMAAELNAQIISGRSLQAINCQENTVTLDDGQQLSYQSLALALGADPIALALQGNAQDAVISVNNLADFAKFTNALNATANAAKKQRVAILGAGLIGCEFANDLLARDISVVVIDMANSVLPRLLPAQASERLQTKLNQAGVEFLLGVSALAVHHTNDGTQISLSDGTTVNADVILSAVGLKPRTTLAAQAGLTINRGIVVDRYLASSNPHIYALGDCVEIGQFNLPYVMPIMIQAKALAATLTGHPTHVHYPAMPVVVKTPACPTVVCQPPLGSKGQWDITQKEDALEARFMCDKNPGQMLGFVLQGLSVQQKQAWAAQVPAWLPTLVSH